MSYDRLISDPEPAFQLYTNVAQADGDEDPAAELKLETYVLEDDSMWVGVGVGLGCLLVGWFVVLVFVVCLLVGLQHSIN